VSHEITDADLQRIGVYVTRTVVTQVLADVARDPENYLSTAHIGKRHKKALRLDLNAEDTFERELRRYHNGQFADVAFYGEERLRDRSLDLSGSPGIAVLVDAVDGTDLVERGLSNWCAASVFFAPSRPAGQRILASFVGLPSGEVYYASAASPAAYVKRGNQEPVEVNHPSGNLNIEDASICFYGQKITNLLSVVKGPLPRNLLVMQEQRARAREQQEELSTRIYNFAGIPMMMRLIDHQAGEAHCIDVVLDVKGQRPHDVVAGAFIAKRAGASLKALDGRDISDSDLEKSLLKPASDDGKLRYVLAANDTLCLKVIRLLSGHLYEMVDQQDRLLSLATKQEIREQKLWRRMVAVMIFDEAGKVLVCKRPASAPAYPGLWTCSAGGHVEVGESYLSAARREAWEELRLSTALEDAGTFETTDERGNVIHHCFKGCSAGPIPPSGDEYEEVRWISLDVLASEVGAHPEAYAPPLKKALELFRVAVR
jgi:isopentenyl-diphosphate delta-isomerase